MEEVAQEQTCRLPFMLGVWESTSHTFACATACCEPWVPLPRYGHSPAGSQGGAGFPLVPVHMAGHRTGAAGATAGEVAP